MLYERSKNVMHTSHVSSYISTVHASIIKPSNFRDLFVLGRNRDTTVPSILFRMLKTFRCKFISKGIDEVYEGIENCRLKLQ